jgi:hypothetical protein
VTITIDPIARRVSWTDQQLTAAVLSQRSWRAVARELGLKGTSAGVIRTLKRHAVRLGLDTSHFIGSRSWTDADLRTAIAAAATWADVIRDLGVSDTADARARAKSRALRLGLDVSHLRAIPVPPRFSAGAADPRNLRDAAPAIVAAWFALRGCAVSVPLEPQDYDLLVALPTGVQRIQVKTTTYRGSDGKWQVGIGRHPYAYEKEVGKIAYDPESIEAFAIVRGDGLLYLIPIAAVAGRSGLVLDAYERYLVGSAASLLSEVAGAPIPAAVG